MAFAPDDSSLSSNQDTNQFLVLAEIEPQISYTTIWDFANWTNWNSLPNGNFILIKYVRTSNLGRRLNLINKICENNNKWSHLLQQKTKKILFVWFLIFNKGKQLHTTPTIKNYPTKEYQYISK